MAQRLCVFLVSLVILPATAHADSILLNGSFELGPPIPTNDIEIVGGTTAILGWTVFGRTVDYIGPPWNVSDGSRAIDLDGRDAILSGIQQTFATLAGQAYVLTFDLSGNPQGEPLVKHVRVGVGGVSQDYAVDSSGQTLDALIWQSIALAFVASGPSTTLSFMSLSATPNSYGALVDHVAVTPVPEPGTLLLCAVGATIAVVRRRVARRGRARVCGVDPAARSATLNKSAHVT